MRSAAKFAGLEEEEKAAAADQLRDGGVLAGGARRCYR
jgi:hypothetical protein